MKIITLITILIITSIISEQAFSQENIENKRETIQTTNDSDEVFVFVEEQAEFPGGQDSLIKFLIRNIKYPELAKELGVQGTVYLKFIVEKDGRITNIKVIRGVHPSIDAEAIRVVKMFPNWIPGKQRGRPVRIYYNLPIKFTLYNEKGKPKKERKRKKRR